MIMMRAVLLASLLALCGGCVPLASQYAPFPEHRDQAPAPGLARLYMIRGNLFYMGSAVANQVLDDGIIVGTLGNGSYLCWERPAGKAVISLDGIAKVSLPVEAGMTYYLYMDALNYQPKSISHAEAQKYLAEYPKPRMKAWADAPKAKASSTAAPAEPAPAPAAPTSPLPRPQARPGLAY